MKLDAMIVRVAYGMSEAAIIEQCAEECAELCHALLKAARVIREESPTPVNLNKVMENVREEINDVLVCVNVLDYHWDVYDMAAQHAKLERWVHRLDERQRVPDEQER